MPMITIATSVPYDDVPDNFFSLLTDLLAAMLQKPRERVVVHLMNDDHVCLGGGEEKALIATLSSIGKIGEDFNQGHMDQLCSFFQKHLSLSSNNVVVRFIDLAPINVAWNGQLRDNAIKTSLNCLILYTSSLPPASLHLTLLKMPIFTFSTNVPADNISADFLKSTSKLIASMLGKPESYVAVHINGGQKMTFGGSDAPAGFGQLMSLGGVGGEKNRSHSAKLFKHLTDGLGIPGNRMYINFVDMRGSDVGYNGSTF